MADRAASSPLHPSPIESAEYKVRLVWHFRTLCATFFYALHCFELQPSEKEITPPSRARPTGTNFIRRSASHGGREGGACAPCVDPCKNDLRNSVNL